MLSNHQIQELVDVIYQLNLTASRQLKTLKTLAIPLS